MKNIILFPGSFDPIHLGHLEMAKNASVQLNADVIFIPAVISVWKEDSAPFDHKLKMIELMIKNEKNMSVSNYEGTTSKEINYSIDTIEHFKKLFPNDQLFLLIGEDQVNEFHRWKNADKISELTRITFFERPNIEINAENVERFNMLELSGVYLNYSSSNIRELVSLDTSDEIIDYISENKLYYMKTISNLLEPSRLSHSLEVAKLARLIAEKNNLNKSAAYISGLLHDIGKNVKKEEVIHIINAYYKEFSDLPSFSNHQFVGEYIAKNIFNVKNKDILSAIKYHATGNRSMSPLSMVVYSADKIEPTRGFDSSELIAACLNDFKNGFIEVLKANKKYLSDTGKDIENRLTSACFKFYL